MGVLLGDTTGVADIPVIGPRGSGPGGGLHAVAQFGTEMAILAGP
jgi:hypothetical protein